MRVEAHGVRAPRGMAINSLGNLYMTVGGMELRGTRQEWTDGKRCQTGLTALGIGE